MAWIRFSHLLLTALLSRCALASASAQAASPAAFAIAPEVFEREVAARLTDVPEFSYLRRICQEMGIRCWLFGGTASAYGHYVKWDLQRKGGDTRYQADRFDYDYTSIYRSTQDIDIVIDGNVIQAEQVEARLRQEFPHFQGAKDAWEVRLLKDGRGAKESLLNNPDFHNQHTDSNSTGLIEVTRPPPGESAVRDLRDWTPPRGTRPHFFDDLLSGRLHYYYSPLHETTARFRAGNNPPILSAIRYLTKAFQFDLEIPPESMARIREIIRNFDPNRDLTTRYARNWVEKNGRKLFQNAIDVENAWNTTDSLGLRTKLMSLGDVRDLGSLAWWMNKEPLRTLPVGLGKGETAEELFHRMGWASDTAKQKHSLVIAHDTTDYIAYESITLARTGDPNIFISRQGAAGENAVHGNGLYVAVGEKGGRGTGYPIRFTLDPKARLGHDFELAQGSWLLVKNKAAIRVIPESLQLEVVPQFRRMLGLDGTSVDHGNRALADKVARRFAVQKITPEERTQILDLFEEALRHPRGDDSAALRLLLRNPAFQKSDVAGMVLRNYLATQPGTGAIPAMHRIIATLEDTELLQKLMASLPDHRIVEFWPFFRVKEVADAARPSLERLIDVALRSDAPQLRQMALQLFDQPHMTAYEDLLRRIVADGSPETVAFFHEHLLGSWPWNQPHHQYLYTASGIGSRDLRLHVLRPNAASAVKTASDGAAPVGHSLAIPRDFKPTDAQVAAAIDILYEGHPKDAREVYLRVTLQNPQLSHDTVRDAVNKAGSNAFLGLTPSAPPAGSASKTAVSGASVSAPIGPPSAASGVRPSAQSQPLRAATSSGSQPPRSVPLSGVTHGPYTPQTEARMIHDAKLGHGTALFRLAEHAERDPLWAGRGAGRKFIEDLIRNHPEHFSRSMIESFILKGNVEELEPLVNLALDQVTPALERTHQPLATLVRVFEDPRAARWPQARQTLARAIQLVTDPAYSGSGIARSNLAYAFRQPHTAAWSQEFLRFFPQLERADARGQIKAIFGLPHASAFEETLLHLIEHGNGVVHNEVMQLFNEHPESRRMARAMRALLAKAEPAHRAPLERFLKASAPSRPDITYTEFTPALEKKLLRAARAGNESALRVLITHLGSDEFWIHKKEGRDFLNWAIKKEPWACLELRKTLFSGYRVAAVTQELSKLISAIAPHEVATEWYGELLDSTFIKGHAQTLEEPLQTLIREMYKPARIKGGMKAALETFLINRFFADKRGMKFTKSLETLIELGDSTTLQRLVPLFQRVGSDHDELLLKIIKKGDFATRMKVVSEVFVPDSRHSLAKSYAALAGDPDRRIREWLDENVRRGPYGSWGRCRGLESALIRILK